MVDTVNKETLGVGARVDSSRRVASEDSRDFKGRARSPTFFQQHPYLVFSLRCIWRDDLGERATVPLERKQRQIALIYHSEPGNLLNTWR